MLICTHCKIQKLETDFYKKASRKSGRDGWCIACRKNYKLENKDRIREQSKIYNENRKPLIAHRRKEDYENIIKKERERYYTRKTNPKYQQRCKMYRENNKSTIKEYLKIYTEVNKEVLKQKKVIYSKNNGRSQYLKHRDYVLNRRKKNRHLDRERYIKWKAANPEKSSIRAKMQNARRKSFLMKATGSFTTEQILKLCTYQRNKCYWCGEKMEKYTIDHYHPISKGGSNDISNIVLSCRKCNCSKNNMSPYLFANKIGRLF